MFTNAGRIASLLALAVIGAPAAARPNDLAFNASANSTEAARPMLFGGATLRFGLDGRKTRPEVALRFTGATQRAGMAPRLGEGIALTGGKNGTARLSFAGQDSRAVGKRLGISGGQTALIVGGVVLVGGLVLLATSGMGDAAAAGFEED